MHHHNLPPNEYYYGQRDHVYVDPANPRRGYKNPHPARWAKDKAGQWKDGVRREGHHVADNAEYYWDEVQAEGRNLWHDAQKEAKEWKHEAEQTASEVEEEARRLADQTKDKVGKHL